MQKPMRNMVRTYSIKESQIVNLLQLLYILYTGDGKKLKNTRKYNIDSIDGYTDMCIMLSFLHKNYIHMVRNHVGMCYECRQVLGMLVIR